MKKTGKQLRVAMLGVTLATAAAFSYAQEQSQTLEKIEVTGSAIRRVESEGALPIQVISNEQIQKSGASSATDLIQSLAVMTGGNFQQASNSVNGGGGGETTAAIHGLDQKYTLVLLNGHRFAPWGNDGSVNLESIPLDAIDRVEVLTDGASALYGSDAIAGVVNFITKKNKTDTAVFATTSIPQQSGGNKYSAGISTGWGNLDTDGWNIMTSYSHDFQHSLLASQRDVSKKGGIIPFTDGGTNYLFYQTSINSLPGNIVLNNSGAAFNPYFNQNNNCGSNPAIFQRGVLCRTNYSALVEDTPASKRDSLYLQGRLRLNSETTLYAEAVYSHYDMNAQYAPPAQPMGLSNNPSDPLYPLWTKYVVPYMTANGITGETGAAMYYRAFDAGGRTDDWVTNARHLVIGAEGTFKGWDYNASLTYSANTQEDNLAGGYLDFNSLVHLISTGAYDPLIPVANQAAAIQPAILHGNFSTSHVMQNVLSFHASKDMYQMAGGMSNLAIGGEYTTLKYDQSNSYLASYAAPLYTAQTADYAVGGGASYLPFNASRDNWGLFAEYLMPVAKKTEVTASVRYDNYAAVTNKDGFSQPDANGMLAPIGSVTQGNSTNATTFKLSFRAQPVDKLLLRGSFGTGFKAPSISQIAAPVQFAGNTSGSYPCPFPGTAGCQPYPAPNVYQYDLISGGNAATGTGALKPETARQWTVGFRYEPVKQVSAAVDLWDIKMNRQIMAVPENLAFSNPSQFASLFVNPYADPFGVTTVALKQFPVNIGQSEYEGFDWEINGKQKTAYGMFTADLNATHMLKQRYQLAPGAAWNSDLGVFGPDNNVVFRNTAHLSLSLASGAFTNTLTANYKSGYRDESYTASGAVVFLQTATGGRGAAVGFAGLQIPTYTLWDWQTRYDLDKKTKLTFGISNLFNTAPPLSLKTVSGNQVGYDGRYTDPTGRAFMARIDYKF